MTVGGIGGGTHRHPWEDSSILHMLLVLTKWLVLVAKSKTSSSRNRNDNDSRSLNKK